MEGQRKRLAEGQRKRLAVLVILGGAAVPGSYAWGLALAGADLVGALWGGLPAALLALRPRQPRWAYWLAVAGSLPFALQTAVLDALLWPAFFPSGG